MFQQVGDGGDGRVDGPLGGVAEAHQQQRRGGRVGHAAVLLDPVQADAAVAGGRDHGRLPRLGRQLRDRVEPGREPGQPDTGRVPGERRHQGRPAGGVDGAHPPQVPVVAARGQQRRQRHLVKGARSAIAHLLLGRDRVGQAGRGEHPAEPDRRRQRLAGGADQEDAVRREALEDADRFLVVAELRVVVVLDDEPVDPPGPVRQRMPPLGGQHHPGRRLVGGGHHHRPGVAGRQRVDHQAVFIDRRVHDAQAHRGRRAQRLIGLGAAVARIFEGNRGDPGLARQRPQDQVEPLRETGADDHPVRVGIGRADPPQVPGQNVAQLAAAARIAVAQIGRGDGAAGLPDGPHPVGPGEAGQVGHARVEVRDQPRPGRPGRRRRRGRRRRLGRPSADLRDPRGRARPAGQVSLGQQLPEALLHDATGQAELARERPRRRQPFAAAQPAAPDRVPQARLQLRAQRLGGRPVEPQQQLRTQTGPLYCHEIGPYQ